MNMHTNILRFYDTLDFHTDAQIVYYDNDIASPYKSEE